MVVLFLLSVLVSGRCHRVVATVLVREGVVGAAYVDGTGPGGYR